MRTPWLLLAAGAASLYLGAGCADDETVAGAGLPPARQTTVGEGIPCGVVDVLQQECAACHSDPPTSGAPQSLLSYDDLLAPAPSDPARTNAEVSLERMQNMATPMPPGAGTTPESIATFETWITAGMPQGDAGVTCTPTQVETTCISDSFWAKGDEGGDDMHPGYACISCHENNDKTGPELIIAGTVFPGRHDRNDCNGVAGIAVQVVDADGKVFDFTTDSAGNFVKKGEEPLSLPITASITANGTTIAMMDPVNSGDCNSCHTEAGSSGAPGRIVAP